MPRGVKKIITKSEPNIFRCTICTKEKKETDFYKSNSIIFKGTTRMCICKDCLIELYGEFVNKYNDTRKAVFKICEKFDVYFDNKLFDSVEQQAKSQGSILIQIYFQKVNSMNQYSGLTFENSDNDETEINNINSTNIIDQELITRWGKSFSKDELQFLEVTYNQWLTHHDCDKLSIQKLVQMICIKELEIRTARESGKATDKLEKSLMELMNSSNLTPRTMSAVNETDSSKIYGVWLKDIEQNRPAEYFQNKKLYYDFDGIMDYFNRFILRPMKNLLTNTREFDKEFMIEDEVDEDEKGDDE